LPRPVGPWKPTERLWSAMFCLLTGSSACGSRSTGSSLRRARRLYEGGGKAGRYVGDFFVWMRDADFRDFVLQSPLPEIAAGLMGSRRVNLFYDHLLVKEPRTEAHTPWHQDLPYWPVRGADVLSLWVPLDPVGLDNGAVQYVRGSHKCGQMYAPTAFGKDSGFAQIYEKMGLPPFPDMVPILAESDLISWDTDVGDIIVHHPLTFHFAGGNASLTERRRAVAVRYLGDDARYDNRPGTFVEKDSIRDGLFEPIRYSDGDPFGGKNFPAVWPRSAA
jgi:ectoine hydroxylase-related dioxygenase (phytanoyl-CoA dioxygenase family)